MKLDHRCSRSSHPGDRTRVSVYHTASSGSSTIFDGVIVEVEGEGEGEEEGTVKENAKITLKSSFIAYASESSSKQPQQTSYWSSKIIR